MAEDTKTVRLSHADRYDIISHLMENRRQKGTGSGSDYWNSVVNVFEDFLTYVRERKEKETNERLN